MSTRRRRSSLARSLHVAATLVLLALLTSATLVSAQPNQAVSEDWRNADYGFNSSMMDTDQNDKIYALGSTPATNILNIKKFSPAGALLWQTTYDPVESVAGVWIAVDAQGNAAVQANTIRATDGSPTGWVTLKYDPDGNLLWTRSVQGAFTGAVRVEVDAAGNIYAAGFSFNDALLIKYSPAGDTLWSRVFDNNGAIDKASALVISPDNSRVGWPASAATSSCR